MSRVEKSIDSNRILRLQVTITTWHAAMHSFLICSISISLRSSDLFSSAYLSTTKILIHFCFFSLFHSNYLSHTAAHAICRTWLNYIFIINFKLIFISSSIWFALNANQNVVFLLFWKRSISLSNQRQKHHWNTGEKTQINSTSDVMRWKRNYYKNKKTNKKNSKI